ncbi:MAG: hypothetical protein HQL50_00375 [Magnetococcales bacterium]|nr:hypothetical protein [Magnetococcales bacterium]
MMQIPTIGQYGNNRSEERFDVAAWLTLAGISLYILVSDNLLVSRGIPYNAPGGPGWSKLHPGTYLIVMAFLWVFLTRNPMRFLSEMFHKHTSILMFGMASLGTLIYSTVRFGAGGNGFLIDTLIVPSLLGLLLLSQPRHVQEKAVTLTVFLLAINAVIGLGESILQERMVPYLAGDEPLIEEIFRSTALGGHPLTNALRTSVAFFTVLAVYKPPWRTFLLGLFALALLAFGSRTALVVVIGLGGLWGVWSVIKGMASKKIKGYVILLLAIWAILTPIIGGVAIVKFRLGERIFQEFTWDESANSRILAFKLFDHIKTDTFITGVGPVELEHIVDRLRVSTALNDIENVWYLLLAEFGAVAFLFLIWSMMAMMLRFSKESPAALKMTILTFLVMISSSNSLAVKSQNLAIFMVLVIGARAALGIRMPGLSDTKGETFTVSYKMSIQQMWQQPRPGKTVNSGVAVTTEEGTQPSPVYASGSSHDRTPSSPSLTSMGFTDWRANVRGDR